MDNEKSFRRIVLLLILIVLILLSLIISRIAGSPALKTVEESATEEQTSEAAIGETQAAEPEAEGPKAEDTDEESAYAEDIEKALEEARRKREEDERYVEYRRKLARESQKKAKETESSEKCEVEQTEEEQEEEPYVPPTVLIVSDLHYISAATYDGGNAFTNMMMRDDGKLSVCSDDILEGLIDEAIARKVSALIMAGDNTFNGERENHEELARRLKRLKEAGIPVLLVPGNHDINNKDAAVYFGDEAEEAEYLHSADEYYEIYEEFYEGMNTRDPDSLSYVYPLDETHWIMLLDSAWYEDTNHVIGKIRPETLIWMEDVFESASEVGAVVVPVAHHNLLSESRYYTKECIMENADEVIELLEAYEIPLFLSGHLHAQRIKKHKSAPGVSDDEYGITEIVSSPISIAPCQYGILSWDEDNAMHYEVFALTDHLDKDRNYIGEETIAVLEESPDLTQSVAVIEKEPEETETFTQDAAEFTKMIIASQIEEDFPNLSEEVRHELGQSYAEIYYLYCSGSYIDWDEFTRSAAYGLWEKYSRTDEYIDEMRAMARDNTTDYHSWDFP